MSRIRTAVPPTVALLLLLAGLALAATPALAGLASGVFELDGNAADSKAGLPEDWNNVYRSVTGQGTAAPSSALVQMFLSDRSEPDGSTFGLSNKDYQRVNQWQCNTDNNPQSKTNIMNAYAALYGASGSLQLFFGADRESTTGDSNFGFWLFQSPVSCVPTDKGGTGHFTGHKTHGDLFIVSEFTNGGKISTIKVYKWTDPDRIPENGDECLGDGVDCSPAHAGQAHPFATGPDCQGVNLASTNVCATVNQGGLGAAWRQDASCADGQFFEGGINLSALAQGTCFGSLLIETRASQEFSADLKDFVVGEFGTCGEITIRKKAIGGDDHFDFDVMTGSLTPHPFTLQNGGVQTFTGVKAGAYAITELAAPAGWTLTDLACASSGGDTTATTSLATATATIAMGLAGTVDCTFTNTRLPTLTVVKRVLNDNGGTATASSFTLKIDGVAVTSGVAKTVAAGTHTVSEAALPAGYVQVGITGDCDASGKVTLAAGDNKTCTITNRDVAPRLTVVKHVVNDDGGTKAAADFTIQVTGTGVSTPAFPGSEAGTTVTLKAGAYSVDEVAAAGYAKTLSADCAGTIAVGQSKTCTITNDDVPARLVVIKKVSNTHGGTRAPGDFTMTVTGNSPSPASFPGADAPGTTVTLKPGAYSVDEVAAAGYAKALSADCAGTIAAGQTKTCTVTNSDIAPQLKVIKHVVNDDGGTKAAADFTIQVTGTSVSTPAFPGSEAGTTVTLDAGAYSVDEAAAAGYAKTLSADCAGTIAVGQSRTCTITNDDVAATLVVIKKVSNTHGGTKGSGDFTMTVTGNSPSPASFPGADGSGTTVKIKPGAYGVDEVAAAGYAKTLSADCAGTIALGETRTCIVTNSDIAATLTVIKHVINDNGGTATAGSFTIQVAGSAVSPPAFPGAEAGTTVTLNPGAYSVDEVAAAGYAKTLSADCAGTIALGEHRTCTITNDDIAPTLTVIKNVVNDNGGTATPASFTMTVTGTSPSLASFPGASGAGTTITLAPGAYSVAESGPGGYAGTFSADCAGTIALGEHRTCTVTNDDIAPRLTVVKHVINDNGGIAVAGSFTMLVTGTGVSTPSFPGSETGTTVTLAPGAYSVDEIGAAGYVKTLGADCSGTIALGESKTCVVTNNDPAPRPFGRDFCDEPTVVAVMDPANGRFPGNLGPDVVVDGRTQSIQAAIDAAADANGDGFIIVGVVANDGHKAGGTVSQSIEIAKAYGKPFAVVACGVLLHDPLRCDGIPAVTIQASATSPAHPAASGVTLYVHGLSTEHSESSPGFLVQGDGRYLEGAGATDSMIGIKVVGNNNTLHGGLVHNNFAGGIVVEGNDNTIDTVQILQNSGDSGIRVTGSGNRLVKNVAGNSGKGNDGNGITVAGSGNMLLGNSAHANGGDGISVSGGSAGSPNVLKLNLAGAAQKGNGGNGIVVAGNGNGAGAPIEIEQNTTQGNTRAGIKVTGSGHQLKNNVSGGFGTKNNSSCEYDVAAGNINATGNKSGLKSIPGSNASAFPTGCK